MKKNCARCDTEDFRRVNRIGFWERKILAPLGFFPWECVICRRKIYIRQNGHEPAHGRTRTRPNE